MFNLRVLLVVLLAFTQSNIFASYKGSISFSSKDKAIHKNRIIKLMEISKNCLERYKNEHLDFYYNNCITNQSGETYCLSKFYGERRYSLKKGSRRSDGRSLEFLPSQILNLGFDSSVLRELESTSCVGMALSCLKEGFTSTGQSAQWNKIMRFVRANNVGGTALQHALQKIGWKIYYWNSSSPDTIDADTKKWDREERGWASKGWHNYRLQTLRRNNKYWYNYVDDYKTMTGFEKGTPSLLYSVPFWVGTAHTGYHVFPGTHSEVVEAHSTRHFTSFDNLEFNKFAPMAPEGAPRWTSIEKYRSGLIAIPPL